MTVKEHVKDKIVRVTDRNERLSQSLDTAFE